MDRFRMLQYGIAVVLAFVGLKMTVLDGLWGGRFPVGISLAIIVATIGIAVLLSLVRPKVAG
jgi:tellurite resistance protein TerC